MVGYLFKLGTPSLYNWRWIVGYVVHHMVHVMIYFDGTLDGALDDILYYTLDGALYGGALGLTGAAGVACILLMFICWCCC